MVTERESVILPDSKESYRGLIAILFNTRYGTISNVQIVKMDMATWVLVQDVFCFLGFNGKFICRKLLLGLMQFFICSGYKT